MTHYEKSESEKPPRTILSLNVPVRFGALLIVMGRQSRSESLFRYFRVEDHILEDHVPRLIALKADFQIACTGTPVENRLLDLWNIFDSVQPGLLSSAKEFIERFESRATAAAENGRLQELKRRLLFQQSNSFLLRRTKADVANLPGKHIVKIECPMSAQEIEHHRNVMKNCRADFREKKSLVILQRFAQLSQHPALLTSGGEDAPVSELVESSSKLKMLIDKLHDIRGRREKAIIFARHQAMQRILAKVLEAEFHLPVRIINGETKTKASLYKKGAMTRTGILDEFRTKPGFNVVVLSPFVAGIGLTITEANHVFHYGRWWNPAVEGQATDRAYRIGQTKEVFVYVPIFRDPSRQIPVTFDERLDALMERKSRLAEDFLTPLPSEEAMAGELFESLDGAS